MKNETETPSPALPKKRASMLAALSISNKITLLSCGMVVLTVVVLSAVLLIEKTRLAPALATVLNQQAFDESDKIAKMVYDSCSAAEQTSQRQLANSLSAVRDLVQQQGGVVQHTEKVQWEAENQLTHQKSRVDLPKFYAGTNWFGQNTSASVASLIVDDIKHFTTTEATVFQRMNEAGDMLRVCTSILRPDGTRAVGTFIPALNPDGTPSAVVASVLKGETFHGRALVLDAWHNAAYEPLWDAAHEKVIGMLFAGVNMTESTRGVRDGMLKITLGKSGYIFSIAGKGDQRGHYLVSRKGEQDGTNVWDTVDVNGKHVIQDLIAGAMTTKDGQSSRLDYLWLTPGEKAARMKFASATYFPAWDWVIGASAFYDEYAQAQNTALATLTHMLWWTVGVAVGIAFLAFGVSFYLSRSISRPLQVLADTAQKVADGDNDARADIHSKDEIGQLANSFNSMIDARVKAKEDTDDYKRLQEGIRQLLQVTSDASDGDMTVRAKVTEGALGNVGDAVNLMLENVEDLLKEVQAAANRVASSATEIQASSEQLSQGAAKQSGEIINTTTAVQEMAANIESVSNNATSASEAATRARDAAENGAKAVEQVIDGMERIRQNVQAGAKKIKRLGERSMEISTIVNTISQISSQTDMLALNAAIEAARAGEHGRGFTVVAEEVRKLAERTATATKEIEKLIAGIQAETNESVSAMEQQTVEVETESKMVAGTGGELSRIRESSGQSAELINEINLAAKQQVRGASGVVKAMETVSTIAQQAQSGAAQTKRATESLASLSTDLLASLGKFKIGSN